MGGANLFNKLSGKPVVFIQDIAHQRKIAQNDVWYIDVFI